MTKHFKISLSKLPKPQARFLHEKIQGPSGQIHEQICVMGQILQQLGERTITKEGPIRFLHELKTAIPPFTRNVRGFNLQSDLTHTIMTSDPFCDAGRTRISQALSYYNMTIEFGE